MKILLTNDDGYNAPGITILAEELKKKRTRYNCSCSSKTAKRKITFDLTI